MVQSVPDWDLIRYFLAVARSGSTLKAAQSLKESQPTIARRIAALERAVGQPLFDRRPTGYCITEPGRALLPTAEAIEAEAHRFWNGADAGRRLVTGTVRFTTVDIFANHGLAELLRAFREHHPGIQIEVVVTDRLLDLAAGEADVALRARPTPGPFVCRKVAEFSWSAFCSRDYAAAHGRPERVEDLARHAVIGGEGGLAGAAPLRWLAEHVPPSAIQYRSNSMQNLIASLTASLGVGVVGDPFAARHPELIPCFPLPPELNSQGWLLTHESLKDQPRIRAFTDFVADYLSRRRRAGAHQN